MIRWEIFYTDGTSISNEDMTPFAIPFPRREGVQVIIQEDDDRVWRTLSGTDYYYWDDKGRGAKWWPCNDRTGLDFYLRHAGSKCVLFGEWIEPIDFRLVFNKAREKWGERGSFASDEQKPGGES